MRTFNLKPENLLNMRYSLPRLHISSIIKSLQEQVLALLSADLGSKHELEPLDPSTLSEWCVDVEVRL